MLEVLLGSDRLELMREGWSTSPLDVAVCARSVEVCRRLLRDRRVDSSLNGVLHHAVERGNAEIVEILLSHKGVDRDEENDDVCSCGMEFCDCSGNPT
jgi:hypothetical protein